MTNLEKERRGPVRPPHRDQTGQRSACWLLYYQNQSVMEGDADGKGREGRRGRCSSRLVWLSWDSRTRSAASMAAGHQGGPTAMLRITGPSDSLVPRKDQRRSDTMENVVFTLQRPACWDNPLERRL